MNNEAILKISISIALIVSFISFVLSVMVNSNWLCLMVAAIIGMVVVMIWIW